MLVLSTAITVLTGVGNGLLMECNFSAFQLVSKTNTKQKQTIALRLPNEQVDITASYM